MNILITGASRGIGLGLAQSYAQQGHAVYLTGRSENTLKKECDAISAKDGNASYLVMDHTTPDICVQKTLSLDAEIGGIDLFIANAGFAGFDATHNLTQSSWEVTQEIINTNLVGSTVLIQCVLQLMVKRGKGHIVGISSISADCPSPLSAAYGASKIGLTYFLESAAIEAAAFGVDVTIIHPGFIETDSLEGFGRRFPLQMSVNKAIRHIEYAIEKKKRLYRFPKLMGIIAMFPKLLPRILAYPLIAHFSKL